MNKSFTITIAVPYEFIELIYKKATIVHNTGMVDENIPVEDLKVVYAQYCAVKKTIEKHFSKLGEEYKNQLARWAGEFASDEEFQQQSDLAKIAEVRNTVYDKEDLIDPEDPSSLWKD